MSKFINRWLHNPCDNLFDHAWWCPGQGCVGTHTAGVGPEITVEYPLKILSRHQRYNGKSVSDAQQRNLWPIKVFLDHNPAIWLFKTRARMLDRFIAITRHNNTLAGSETVVLYNVRCAELVKCSLDFDEVVAHMGQSGGHTCLGHDFLGEGLTTFELRRGTAWAKHVETGRTQMVGSTDNERAFRSDDD